MDKKEFIIYSKESYTVPSTGIGRDVCGCRLLVTAASCASEKKEQNMQNYSGMNDKEKNMRVTVAAAVLVLVAGICLFVFAGRNSSFSDPELPGDMLSAAGTSTGGDGFHSGLLQNESDMCISTKITADSGVNSLLPTDSYLSHFRSGSGSGISGNDGQVTVWAVILAGLGSVFAILLIILKTVPGVPVKRRKGR